jgi:hypothetical protein
MNCDENSSVQNFFFILLTYSVSAVLSPWDLMQRKQNKYDDKQNQNLNKSVLSLVVLPVLEQSVEVPIVIMSSIFLP